MKTFAGARKVKEFRLGDILPKAVYLGEMKIWPTDYTIFFHQDRLVWGSSDNRVGVIKYNTLTASGDWNLSEVTIEELL